MSKPSALPAMTCGSAVCVGVHVCILQWRCDERAVCSSAGKDRLNLCVTESFSVQRQVSCVVTCNCQKRRCWKCTSEPSSLLSSHLYKLV